MTQQTNAELLARLRELNAKRTQGELDYVPVLNNHYITVITADNIVIATTNCGELLQQNIDAEYFSSAPDMMRLIEALVAKIDNYHAQMDFFYNFIGRDYGHMELKDALPLWADNVANESNKTIEAQAEQLRVKNEALQKIPFLKIGTYDMDDDILLPRYSAEFWEAKVHKAAKIALSALEEK